MVGLSPLELKPGIPTGADERINLTNVLINMSLSQDIMNDNYLIHAISFLGTH